MASDQTDELIDGGPVDAPGDDSPGAGPTVTRAFISGVPDLPRAQLLELGVLDPVERADDADLVILSTRLRRAELSAEIAAARAHELPIVVLAHTGGESNAVEMLRNGGRVVLAEGNESALLTYLQGSADDAGLCETYEQRLGSASHVTAAGDGDDSATGLPGLSAFEERLEHLNQDGDLPRVAFMRLINLGDAHRLSPEAVTLLRRRLALQLLALARMHSADLFALRDEDLALVAVGLSPNRTESVARQMTKITESFAPSGAQPLGLAVGHAGPEVASELNTLRELASRAMMVAAESGKSRIVGADSLSLGLAATTELEAALRAIEVVERSDGLLAGHGTRVASMAHDVARQLGFEPAERTQVRLAAHLADIGKIGLPPQAQRVTADTEPALRARYEEHPRRGAESLRASAGAMVADAVASHHERWDGSGFPDGLAGTDIPLIGRIIAVADALDHMLNCESPEDRASIADAVERVRADAGTLYDPDIVEIAISTLGTHHLVGGRR